MLGHVVADIAPAPAARFALGLPTLVLVGGQPVDVVVGERRVHLAPAAQRRELEAHGRETGDERVGRRPARLPVGLVEVVPVPVECRVACVETGDVVLVDGARELFAHAAVDGGEVARAGEDRERLDRAAICDRLAEEFAEPPSDSVRTTIGA